MPVKMNGQYRRTLFGGIPLCLLLLAMLAMTFGRSAVVAAGSQVITLDSGERLIGEVLPKSTEDTLFLNSNLFGELSVPRARVEAIQPQALSPEPAEPEQPIGPPAAEVGPKAVSPKQQAPAKAQSKPVNKPKHVVAGQEGSVDPEELIEEEQRMEQKLVSFLTGLHAPETWSGNMRMGFNISSGDSKWTETYLRGKLEVRPVDSASLYRYTGSYTYRENEKDDGEKFKSQDKYDANFLYRYSFENDWFLQNTANWRVDQKKGINRDLSNLVGAGYSFKPKPTIEWNVGGSGGIEDYDSSGEDSRNGTSTSLSVFEELKWTPLTRTSLVHSFNYFWNPDDSQQYNYVIKAALRVRLTDLLGFEFSYNKDYDNDTGAGKNKDDTRWLNAMILFF